MRILALNWRDVRDPLGGGAEIHLHEILTRCVAAGHEVDLVVAGYEGASEIETIDGIRIHRKGHWTVANFVLPGVVKGLLRERSYDLVVEDINKIPFYTPLFCGDVPIVAVVPHLFGSTVFREANPLVASYVWGAERLIPAVYRKVDFEVISPSTRDDLIRRGMPAERVRTVYCGMEHERFRLDDPPPRDEDPLLVSWSRLRRYKSVDVAIRAFALIQKERPSARLLVMGQGPDEQRLRRLVSRTGLDGVVSFTGHLPWSELVRTLHRAHVFLNPSPKEGWGLTVIEANECGVPVVASDRPGLRDSVRHGETGLLVPYGDPGAMAAAALQLLNDEPRRAAFGAAAREWAQSFSWDRCAEESLEIFAAAVARAGGRT